MFVYGVLYTLIWRAIHFYTTRKHRLSTLLIPLLFTILYAVTDEIHQSTVLGRTATIRDVGYDFLGASISLILVRKHN
jgi:VanZ family protein